MTKITPSSGCVFADVNVPCRDPNCPVHQSAPADAAELARVLERIDCDFGQGGNAAFRDYVGRARAILAAGYAKRDAVIEEAALLAEFLVNPGAFTREQRVASDVAAAIASAIRALAGKGGG